MDSCISSRFIYSTSESFCFLGAVDSSHLVSWFLFVLWIFGSFVTLRCWYLRRLHIWTAELFNSRFLRLRGRRSRRYLALLHPFGSVEFHLAVVFLFGIGICFLLVSASSRTPTSSLSFESGQPHLHPPHSCLVLRSEVSELGPFLSFASLIVILVILVPGSWGES